MRRERLRRARRSPRAFPPRIYTTSRLKAPPATIDGRLDDAAWTQGEWAGNYTQQLPTEGAAPSRATELKVLFDEKNIYVAIRAHDDLDEVSRYPTRRDGFAGDIVGVCFDSNFDKRTGFEFDLNAAGSKFDLILTNEGWDTNWDAVWFGKVGTESGAWTAEFQIPLSQPGLHLNDVGFLRQADVILSEAELGFQETDPRGPFRQFSFKVSRDDAWDFGGLQTEGSTGLEATAKFRNKWESRRASTLSRRPSTRDFSVADRR